MPVLYEHELHEWTTKFAIILGAQKDKKAFIDNSVHNSFTKVDGSIDASLQKSQISVVANECPVKTEQEFNFLKTIIMDNVNGSNNHKLCRDCILPATKYALNKIRKRIRRNQPTISQNSDVGNFSKFFK